MSDVLPTKQVIRLVVGCALLLLTRYATAEVAIASAHPLATAAGIEVLQKGGNAFDAAIAVTATLAVVEPTGSGLGGGGFWLLHRAADQSDIMLDGRERAPAAATRDMYLDDSGAIVRGLSINGALAAGIPGEPAALSWLAANYGRLPLADSLQAAIDHARNGFEVGEHYQRLAGFRLEALRQSAAASQIFLDDNEVPEPGFKLIQNDLAQTLEEIASKGHDGFYSGRIAAQMVKSVRRVGGMWTLKDLQDYAVVVRKPVVSQYRDIMITSAALPSSGGLVMAQILNILDGFDLEQMLPSQRIHTVAEAMRRAYRDRAQYMGDSDFVEVPQEQLLSKFYASGLRQSIHPQQATSSNLLAPTHVDGNGGNNTSHFSIVDTDGNRVAATLSINYPFGSAMVAEGTGILLNDEMDDFSSRPGQPNVYGLVGGEANAIKAGKRMLSSMTPTFIENEEKIAVLGTPGGSRIISMVTLATLAFAEGKQAQQIVDLPRFHHQYLPDQILFEPEYPDQSVLSELTAMGHDVKNRNRTWGNMQIVIIEKKSGKLSAASDKRGGGGALVE